MMKAKDALSNSGMVSACRSAQRQHRGYRVNHSLVDTTVGPFFARMVFDDLLVA